MNATWNWSNDDYLFFTPDVRMAGVGYRDDSLTPIFARLGRMYNERIGSEPAGTVVDFNTLRRAGWVTG